MTAQLRIQFGANPGEAGLAPIHVEVINRDLDVVSSDVYPLTQMPTVTVQPGHYLVRGRLPSGEWMTAQASVAEDDTETVVLTPMQRSPHEHLAWGYYLKFDPESERSGAVRRAMDETVLRDYAPGSVTYEIWHHVPRGPWTRAAQGMVSDVADPRVERLTAEEDPRGLGVLRVDLAQLGTVVTWDSQLWLALKSDWFAARCIALPITSRPARILLRFVGDPAGTGDPLQVVVDSQHAIVESLLNLITTGDFAAARTIWSSQLGQAEVLLQEKIMDRFAAAVGGYFLLLAGDLPRLHDWSKNLDIWFPALPDGAVIHAWHLLRQQGDLDLARDRLIEAAQRGVPFYSCGLRLLVDGLNLFVQRVDENSSEENGQLRDALGSIARYARAARWTEATTTVYGDSPTSPVPLGPEREIPQEDNFRSDLDRLLTAVGPAPQIINLPDNVIIGGVRLHKRRPS